MKRVFQFLKQPSNWLCVVFALGMIHYGSTKGKLSVYNTDTSVVWLRNNGSYVTNDHVHVALTRHTLLPDTADFYCYRRDIALTNAADWVLHFSNTVGQISFPTNIPYANAWSNNWLVGTSYTRQQTHTNGVAIVNVITANGATNIIVPLNIGIYTNGNYKLWPKEL